MIAELLLCGLSLFQDQEFTINERFRVDFVLLDVAVRARDGHLVTDLKPSDFEVKENGKKVDVTYFDVLDFRPESLPPEPGNDLQADEPKPEPRPIQQIIMAIDLESAQPLEQAKTFGQLKELIRSLGGDIDYKICLYSMERGDLTKGFVDTPEQAMDALVELERRSTAFLDRGAPGREPMLLGDKPPQTFKVQRSRPGTIDALTKDVNTLADLEKAFIDCTRHQLSPENVQRCIISTFNAFIEEQRYRTERVLGELEILTYKFQDVDGLKMMLFVSPGFSINRLESAVQLAQVYLGQATQSRDGSRLLLRGEIGMRTEFQKVVHACIRNRVVFHTFDAYNSQAVQNRNISAEYGGLPSQQILSIFQGYEYDITEGIRQLAEESGGEFNSTFDLGPVMLKTIEENRFFYVLGYDSPEGKPGKYRKVRINLKPKGLKASYRRGYIGR